MIEDRIGWKGSKFRIPGVASDNDPKASGKSNDRHGIRDPGLGVLLSALSMYRVRVQSLRVPYSCTVHTVYLAGIGTSMCGSGRPSFGSFLPKGMNISFTLI